MLFAEAAGQEVLDHAAHQRPPLFAAEQVFQFLDFDFEVFADSKMGGDHAQLGPLPLPPIIGPADNMLFSDVSIGNLHTDDPPIPWDLTRQPVDALGDQIAMDVLGAAVDRNRPRVEVVGVPGAVEQ